MKICPHWNSDILDIEYVLLEIIDKSINLNIMDVSKDENIRC